MSGQLRRRGDLEIRLRLFPRRWTWISALVGRLREGGGAGRTLKFAGAFNAQAGTSY